MRCNRGKADPGRVATFRVFAESAGRCQRPACLEPLFADLPTETVHFAEVAHIIAASDGGARANRKATPEERAAVSNLLLLCANCHTLIDKAEASFPVEELKRWKEEHLQRIDAAFGVERFH